MKKIYLSVLVAFLGLLEVQAQQDPHYTQYMYNMSVVNPAYAGSKDGLSLGLLYRKQWVEIEDAPTTGTFFGHSPVGKNVGLGLSVISDKIGPVEENNVYGDFSYTLKLGEEHKLAFGMKAGATFHKVGLFSDIGDGHVPDADDPAFSQNTSNTFLNIGAGLFYYTNKYYIGASIPNMLKSKHLDFNGRKFGSEVSHYFVTGGYVFDISENMKLKPFAMVKSAINAPTSVDVSLNTMLYNKFEAGLTYRLEDSFGAMVNFMITPSLRVGYAYDYIVSDLSAKTKSSHEFMLLYDISFSKKASSSPRFF
jgi:type IX secretion system PorP/SprF family membrane protein